MWQSVTGEPLFTDLADEAIHSTKPKSPNQIRLLAVFYTFFGLYGHNYIIFNLRGGFDESGESTWPNGHVPWTAMTRSRSKFLALLAWKKCKQRSRGILVRFFPLCLGYYSAHGFSLLQSIPHPWFFTLVNPWLLFSPGFSLFPHVCLSSCPWFSTFCHPRIRPGLVFGRYEYFLVFSRVVTLISLLEWTLAGQAELGYILKDTFAGHNDL